MVATRRGVRVYSPTKTTPDQASEVPASPAAGQRTRRTTKQAESPTQHALGETSRQLEKKHEAPLPTSQLKRCTRASRLHSPEQSCTPVGSIHEEEASDVDSCCSALTDVELPKTRTRGRGRQLCTVSQEDETSDVDSCSSAISPSKDGHSVRRSARKKTVLKSPEPAEVGDVKSQRVTRSQRKTAGNRSSAKQQTEDSELSDADSCISSVSGADASKSTTRRATRSRRQTGPIPIHLEEISERSQSPTTRARLSRAAKERKAATVDVSEPPSCDSDGFESGPTYSITTRRQGKTQSTGPKAVDSDYELTGAHSQTGSPCTTQSKGTPCRSRTDSESSNRSAWSLVKGCRVVIVKAENAENTLINDSSLDSTMILEDADCTLLVEDGKQTLVEEGNQTLVEEGNQTLVEDGNQMLVEEGNQMLVEDGNQTLVEEGNQTLVEDGNQTLVEEGNQTLVEEGNQTLVEEGNQPLVEEGNQPLVEEGNQPLVEEGNQPLVEEGNQPLVEEGNQTLEEDGNQMLEEKEKEGVNTMDLTSNTMSVEKGVIVISEDDSSTGSPKISDSPAWAEEDEITPAVTDRHQQEEPCAEHTDGEVSEKMMMQETIQPSEPLKPHQSVPVPLCESASEITGETEEKDGAVEVIDLDAHTLQGDEDAAVETGPGGEEEMEVSTLHLDGQQVVDSKEVQVESIQVTSSQLQNVTVQSDPEQQPKDVIVQNTKIFSLLDSSEDEDEDEDADEEERDVSVEEVDEDLEFPAEERAGPSQKCDAAAASVGGLFMIDTRPGEEADEQYYKERPTGEEGVEQEDQDEEFVDEEGDDDEDAELLFYSRNPQSKELSSRIDPGIRVKELGGLYINFDGSKPKPVSGSLRELKERKIQDEVMKKSVMGPDFEKKDAVPPYSESKHGLKLKRKAEREKSTGDGWFNMKAPEISKELKGDLQVLKMRGSMDPKRFYKKNDRDGFPKYFQVGTVVDNPVDFYHSRVPKKGRKRTMVEELLSDAEFRHNNKKKYQHIVTEKAAQGAGKRNKKTNNKKTSKFHKK